ncbi:MAG TPA: transglutaminase domain-containing protein [Acidobacteriota bacterium]|nr:transglutaminase domain-containing protein [Acidobacteriota bacterium]HNT17356.1 transglutaminase domain-containing protein [Acidobacteriota bacterium]
MDLKKALSCMLFLAVLVFQPPLFSQVPEAEVERSMSVDLKTPTGFVFDGRAFWVGDVKENVIARLDPGTGAILKKYEAPCFTVGGLAWDGKMIWVLDPVEKAVFGLDPERGLTEKTLALDLDTPQGIAFDGKDIWVSDGGEGLLVKIDKGDGTTYASVSAPSAGSGKRSQLIAFTGHDNYLWTADRLGDTLYQVDPETGYVLNMLETPGPFCSGIAFFGEKLACLDYEKRTIDIVILPQHGKPIRFNPRRESVAFGESYRNFGPGTVEELKINIAVPEDLPFQDLGSKIEWSREPDSFQIDKWGQKVALFTFRGVKPQEAVSAGYSVDATLYSVRYFIDPAKCGKIGDVPEPLRKQFLGDDVKLQAGDPVIRAAVREAVGDEKNCYYAARKIYQYIHEKMRYELVGGWNIAPVVLARGSGSCSEYSFVMIAMCRAAGIPARYAGSVVVRGDNASRDDVFHRWVEVYLPSVGWVPVDPSGGDSKVPEEQAKAFAGLDNRFLITTIGGGSSEYLNWDYNSNSSFSARGPVKLAVLKAGDWSPVAEAKREKTETEAGKGPKVCSD